jgi:putative FmdB family regulatory protein
VPIYEYECDSCGEEHELIQNITAKPIRKCPACGRLKLRRKISRSAFHLKGQGWYVTDYAKNGEKKDDKGEDNGESKSESGVKTETKAESKSSESKSSESKSSESQSSDAKSSESKSGVEQKKEKPKVKSTD